MTIKSKSLQLLPLCTCLVVVCSDNKYLFSDTGEAQNRAAPPVMWGCVPCMQLNRCTLQLSHSDALAVQPPLLIKNHKVHSILMKRLARWLLWFCVQS